jgi:hypothetical protein
MMKALHSWIKKSASTLIGVGLMLASSGLDGVYMSMWMPSGWAWLGFVLNTMADISDLYLGHRAGRLIRSKDPIRRWGALAVFAGQLIAIIYSWFFGFRQLLRVFEVLEPTNTRALAFWAAGSIPLLLAVLGIEGGLSSVNSKAFAEEVVSDPVVSDPPVIACPICNATAGKSGIPFRSQAALSGHMSAHKANGNGRKQAERMK